MPDVLNNVSHVSVNRGATLECDGNITIRNLSLDCATGGGMFVGCKFASSGTIDLSNITQKGRVIETRWTFEGCDGVSNLGEWNVSVDGVDKPSYRINVSPAGRVTICPPGLMLVVW